MHFRCLNCSAIFDCSMYGRNLLVWSMNQHVTYRVGLSVLVKCCWRTSTLKCLDISCVILKADLVQYYRETAKRYWPTH